MNKLSNNFFLSAILPEKLIQDIENERAGDYRMLVISRMISNVGIRCVRAWKEGELKKEDPNPGDGQCQIRGFLLSSFYQDKELRKEALELKATLEKAKEIANRRNTLFFDRKNFSESSGKFFKRLFGEITLSKKMEFLLQCYLLAVVRKPIQKLSNGIVNTKSEVGWLSKLARRIYVLPNKTRNDIVNEAQSNLSENSVAFLREEAQKLEIFSLEEKEFLLKMLSPEKVRVYSPDPQYPPKTFGGIFYEYVAILGRLIEEKGIVCFKSIESSKKPFRLFLQANEKGDFSIIDESQLPETTPLVVFEGVLSPRYNKESFSEKIQEIGFYNLILACAAIEPPYERTSSLSTITEKKAKTQIVAFRKFAKIIECQKDAKDPLLILDHVFGELLKNEREPKKRSR